MPGRRAILPSAMFALVVIAALSAQAIRTTHAADECLAKPNGPAPQGQHWYYRIDHANNNRQCWRLGPEGLPVQKAAPPAEGDAAFEPDAQQQARSPRAVIAAPARAVSDAASASAANSTATVSPVPWPEPSKLPAVLPVPLQAQGQPQGPPQAVPQTASADGAVPVAASDDTPAVTTDPSPTGSVRTERSQRLAADRLPPSAAPPQQFAGIDHTFALLMVMFALLAVTGPILHFTHRQRQREVINYKPPRWAPVVPLNAPAPRILHSQVPEPPARIERRPAPRPMRVAEPPPPPVRRPAPEPRQPAEPNERLTRALQQLVDRMQTMQPRQPDAAAGRNRRADVEMLKNAQ
jgi:hypothetical protein